MTPLVVIGAGGHACDVVDVARAMERAGLPVGTVLGLVADFVPDPHRAAARGLEILGALDRIADVAADWVVGIGTPGARLAVAERAAAFGGGAPVLLHPLASAVDPSALGPGTVVQAGARLSGNLQVGPHAFVGHNAVVGHDCRLGAGATVLPGAVVSGDVDIGVAALIGSGAIVREGTRIGDGAVVGAGAVVLGDVPAGAVVVGAPARVRPDLNPAHALRRR
jgi:sugar O-acyltransferase (sialic acid O-acetyltransferase NeuD family)